MLDVNCCYKTILLKLKEYNNIIYNEEQTIYYTIFYSMAKKNNLARFSRPNLISGLPFTMQSTAKSIDSMRGMLVKRLSTSKETMNLFRVRSLVTSLTNVEAIFRGTSGSLQLSSVWLLHFLISSGFSYTTTTTFLPHGMT